MPHPHRKEEYQTDFPEQLDPNRPPERNDTICGCRCGCAGCDCSGYEKEDSDEEDHKRGCLERDNMYSPGHEGPERSPAAWQMARPQPMYASSGMNRRPERDVAIGPLVYGDAAYNDQDDFRVLPSPWLAHDYTQGAFRERAGSRDSLVVHPNESSGSESLSSSGLLSVSSANPHGDLHVGAWAEDGLARNNFTGSPLPLTAPLRCVHNLSRSHLAMIDTEAPSRERMLDREDDDDDDDGC